LYSVRSRAFIRREDEKEGGMWRGGKVGMSGWG